MWETLLNLRIYAGQNAQSACDSILKSLLGEALYFAAIKPSGLNTEYILRNQSYGSAIFGGDPLGLMSNVAMIHTDFNKQEMKAYQSDMAKIAGLSENKSRQPYE